MSLVTSSAMPWSSYSNAESIDVVSPKANLGVGLSVCLSSYKLIGSSLPRSTKYFPATSSSGRISCPGANYPAPGQIIQEGSQATARDSHLSKLIYSRHQKDHTRTEKTATRLHKINISSNLAHAKLLHGHKNIHKNIW